MTKRNIISRGEALRIRKSDLLKAALEKHAAQLKSATEEQRREMMKRIERDIRKEAMQGSWKYELVNVIY